MHRWLALLVLLSGSPVVADQSFLQVSCDMAFPEAIALLQDAIVNNGYKVSRVQHVDMGLRKFGYETGLYRVVFFGRPEQMAMIREKHPELIPYLPLKITLFEDGENVAASALEPATLEAFYNDTEIRQLLDSWQKDLTKIVSLYSQCGKTVSESGEIQQSSLSYVPAGE